MARIPLARKKKEVTLLVLYMGAYFAGGGLIDEEIIKVGGIITADCNKTDYFFILEGHFKKLYVYSLLQKRL